MMIRELGLAFLTCLTTSTGGPHAAAPKNVVAPLEAPPAGAATGQQDADAILERAAARHRELRGLQVAFTQRIRNPILEKDETSAGVFYYRAPLRYRIAFSRPPEDVVVSTGERVWIYLPSTQPDQVIVAPVGEETKALAPYQFLDEFRERYTSGLVGEEPIGGRPSYHLKLTPASPTAGYARAELWIDKATSLTRQMELEEENGVVRRFTLSDHRPDPRLADSLFRFQPPPGVEVFEQ